MRAKVVVAMSGGVDSSVVAALLVKQGYECIGMHLKFWSDDSPAELGGAADERGAASLSQPQNKCCTLGSLEDARRIATKLGMPFYVMNVRERFKEKVVDYFLDGYAKGETPNPCIKCNKTIKFGELLARAHQLKADYLATGHYVKRIAAADGAQFELHMATDKAKDQSYFLYHLPQEKLARVLFPLGDLLKTEVYERAREFGFTRVSEKKESQGICFFKEATPMQFLKRHLKSSLFEGGPVVARDGRVLGTHHGLPLYTIGQRQGLGIGGVRGERDGEPWYVIAIDRGNNALIVGRREELGRLEFVCRDIVMISGQFPGPQFEAAVRIRHRGQTVPAVVRVEGATAVVTVSEPVMGLSPGQAAVFYDGEKVLGGGTIVSGLTTSYEKEARATEDRGALRCVSTAH